MWNNRRSTQQVVRSLLATATVAWLPVAAQAAVPYRPTPTDGTAYWTAPGGLHSRPLTAQELADLQAGTSNLVVVSSTYQDPGGAYNLYCPYIEVNYDILTEPVDFTQPQEYRVHCYGSYDGGDPWFNLVTLKSVLLPQDRVSTIGQWNSAGAPPTIWSVADWPWYVAGSWEVHQLRLGQLVSFHNCPPEFSVSLHVYQLDVRAIPLCGIDTVVSILDHDGTDLALDLTTNGIEPRLDGVQKLEFGVNCPASSVTASVSCVNNTYTGTITTTPAGATVTVEFDPALPDQDCCEVTLTGDIEGFVQVQPLRGDANRNSATTTADALVTKLRFGQDAATAGPEFDFNCSGTVTVADYLQVKLYFGNAAPACP